MTDDITANKARLLNYIFMTVVIQFWWIPIWGINYIIIDLIAGPSKLIEFGIYIAMLVIMTVYTYSNPAIVEWF